MSYLRDISMYIAILLFLLSLYLLAPVEHDGAFALWIAASVAVVYFPLTFVRQYFPRDERRAVEDEPVLVRNDITHFRELVDKALKENPVAQREVEMRLLEMVSMDLALRYEVPPRRIVEMMGNEERLGKYLGSSARIVADIFRRRHELMLKIPRDRFLREVNEVMEEMK
jgi:hypothetical protein